MTSVEIGSEFAGYRIETVAGEGAMGRVYRATQMALKRQVALKLIMPELAEDPAFRARFERESELAASIEHPNVIPVYEAGNAEGRLFIAMRWVEGTDLRSIIVNEGRLEPGRAAGVIAQVAAALDAAHRNGLVHRDVKPANVMVTRHDGEHVYLMDFGLTKRTASGSGVTKTGQFVGTPDYMAPEQIKGQQVDARADVYALGCLIFHVLTGHVPYDRDSHIAKMYAHISDPPPSVAETADVPAAVDEVIERALAKDPEERYPSAGDVGRAARAALTGQTPSVPERSLATGPAAATATTDGATEMSPGARPSAEPAATELGAPPSAPEPAATELGAPPSAPEPAATELGAPPTELGAPPTELGAPATELGAPPTSPGSASPALPSGPSAPASGGEPPVEPSKDSPQASASQQPRKGRGRVGLLIVGLVALVALLVLGLLATTGTFSPQRADEQESRPSGSVSIPVGVGASGVAVGEGAVWISNKGDATVSRIDPASSRVVGEPIRVGANPRGVAVGAGAVWVPNAKSNTVSRIDPASAVVGQSIRVGAVPRAVAVAEGVAWVANAESGTVSRIDAASGRVAGEPIRVGAYPLAVAVGAGTVWVANAESGTVSRIDQASGRVIGQPIRVGRYPRGIAVGAGAVWVTNSESGTVSRIDPASGRVVGQPIRVGSNPVGAAVGEGVVWVANAVDGTVSRIDPASGRVVGQPIRVGEYPRGVAVGAGAVWVPNANSATVSRIDP